MLSAHEPSCHTPGRRPSRPATTMFEGGDLPRDEVLLGRGVILVALLRIGFTIDVSTPQNWPAIE